MTLMTRRMSGSKRYVFLKTRIKKEKREYRAKQEQLKLILANSFNFTTKLDDEVSMLGFLCHLIKMTPLLLAKENLDLLDEKSLVTNIKSNVIRYEDAKAISKDEALGEIIGYFTRNYLNDPNLLSVQAIYH